MISLLPNLLIKKGASQYLPLNKFCIQQWLKTFDTIIFDADGVLWKSEEPVEGSPETFNALRAMGKRAFICTNHSSFPRAKLFEKAKRMGILVSEDDILSSAWALANYLKSRNFKGKAYVLGSKGITDELAAAGIAHLPLQEEPIPPNTTLHDFVLKMELDPEVRAVVVGMEEGCNIVKLTKACCYLRDPKVLFLVTNKDRAFTITPERLSPGTGTLVAAVQAIVKRSPFICGKPNSYMCLHLISQGIIDPERTVMVGDTLYTDVLFGYNCGFQTLVVGTGNTTYDDIIKSRDSKEPLIYQQIPDLFLPRLSDLLKFLPYHTKNR